MDTTRTKLFVRLFLSVVLVCGLLLPASAYTAIAEPANDPAQPEASASAEPEANASTNPDADASIEPEAGASAEPGADASAQPEDNAPTQAPSILPFATDDTQFGLTVIGGKAGVDYEFITEDYSRPARAGTNVLTTSGVNKLLIKTSTPLTLRNADPSADSTASIWIAPGTQANVTFDGVKINSPIPCTIERNRNAEGASIEPKTSLTLTLADGTANVLRTSNQSTSNPSPGLRCGEDTILTIDDSVPNVDTSGNPIQMDPHSAPGKIPAGVTFKGADGKTRTAGTEADDDRLELLECANPGKLEVYGSLLAAAIGSSPYENSGTITINGGDIKAVAAGPNDGNYGFGAAIGGSHGGSGGTLIFNGGKVETIASYHAASIGGGAWAHSTSKGDTISYPFADAKDSGLIATSAGGPDTVPAASDTSLGSKTCAGDIYINGGLIIPRGGLHGNAIGKGCCSYNRGHEIVIAGGTVMPDTRLAQVPNGNPKKDCVSFAIGAEEGAVSVVGGSVRVNLTVNGKEEKYEATINGKDSYDTAYGIYPVDTSKTNNPTVSMVSIDLSGEVVKDKGDGTKTEGNNQIVGWQVLIGGEPYEYGKPLQMDGGKLYLWLPPEAKEKQVTVVLSYLDDDGVVQKVDPLFRNPGQDDLLKRYIDFYLPQEYLDTLEKYYDGKPFESLRLGELDENGNRIELTTEEDPPKQLWQADKIKYKYQLLDENDEPHGAEVETGASMPSDAGKMLFTMTSTQYSDDKSTNFSESYWGHRATGHCVIKKIPSIVEQLSAEWDAEPAGSDQKPGSVEHDAHQTLTLSAKIRRGETVDGKPLASDRSNATALTCGAPKGFVQLYVDDEPVGEPVELVFDAYTDADGVVHPKNASAESDANGNYTQITHTFAPAQADWLFPKTQDANEHDVSLRLCNSNNYLDSANPAEDETAPKATVKVTPVDPSPSVTPEPDPDNKLPDPKVPEVSTNATPDPDPDGNAPADSEDKTYQGTIKTSFGIASDDNPHPGRVLLKVKTNSTAPIMVTGTDGGVFVAEFEKDEQGNPKRNPDGTYTLVLDPTSVGEGTLTFEQQRSGAYVGTRWVYDVTVEPDPGIAPDPRIIKTAQNMTDPAGPTQPGDAIHYEVTAANDANGSLWKDVTISDPLPASLELVEGSVVLSTPDGKKTTLAPAAEGEAPGDGQYALSTPDAQGKRTISVFAGNVAGQRAATLSFDCVVKTFEFQTADATELDLGNVASATGKRPNPDPTGDDLGPIDTPPIDPVTPPGPGHVVPGDPDMRISKTVSNETRNDGTTHIGDTVRYVIALSNAGAADTVLFDAVIADPLPTGFEPVPGSLTLTLADGTQKPVPDAAYDKASRTIAIAAGNLWGSQGVELAFECVVDKAAVGADNANVAKAYGDTPTEEPNHDPKKTETEPGTPVTPPADDPSDNEPGNQPGNPNDPSDPGDEPGGTPGFGPEAVTPGVVPPIVVPNDPQAGDVTVSKTAANLTRDDGTTEVGDVVRYTIVLTCEGDAVGWMDAFIRDDVPTGIEPMSGTIKLTRADGSVQTVPDQAYDPASRMLAVSVGHIASGQQVTLAFDALVAPEAQGADVGNVALAFGTKPSEWTPEGQHPEPGTPFPIPNDKDAFFNEFDDTEKTGSEAAYPPGVGKPSSNQPADDPTKDDQPGKTPGNDPEAPDNKQPGEENPSGNGNGIGSTDDGLARASDAADGTIANTLPKTGDAAFAAAAVALAGALIAAGTLWAHRRKARSQR